MAVTRPAGQARELCALLEAEGGVPIPCPAIGIAPPASYADLDRALAALDSYRWTVFTSVNAVQAVVDRLQSSAGSLGSLVDAHVAAVGPATRESLEECGVRVSYVPDVSSAERLAATLSPVEGERVLFPCSDRARPTLSGILAERGALVDRVIAYRTVPKAPAGAALAELRRGVDAIAFASPSAVEGFGRIGPEWRDLVDGAIVATIGPTTSAAVRAAGLEDWVEASEHTGRGLVQALVQRFGARPRETRGEAHG